MYVVGDLRAPAPASNLNMHYACEVCLHDRIDLFSVAYLGQTETNNWVNPFKLDLPAFARNSIDILRIDENEIFT